MNNPIANVIGAIDTRLKRLEETIGNATDAVLQFMTITEDIGVDGYLYIYKRDIHTSFLLGHGIIGVTSIGDRRGTPVLLYSGDGS